MKKVFLTVPAASLLRGKQPTKNKGLIEMYFVKEFKPQGLFTNLAEDLNRNI